ETSPMNLMTHSPAGRFSAPSRNADESDTSWYGTLGLLAAGIAVLMAAFCSGCSNDSRAHAVDPPRAREALNTALDHWKSGAPPRSLQSSATPMIVQDFDWAAGVSLLDYQVVGDGKPYDANLSVPVKLVLSGPGNDKARVAEKNVWYLVGTSPAVTVFRDIFR